MEREIRGGIPAEIRADDDGGIKVSGYAAVFNEETDIGGMFREKIAPGAFSNALTDDVIFNYNHDDDKVMARTRSGTLSLQEDEKGLYMETTLDADDPDVKAIVGKMKRGDLDKMSFAFFMDGGKQEWDDTGEIPMRTIQKVGGLHDVSIVTTPAYDGTEIGLRSLEKHRKSKNFNAAAKRLRMKTDLAKRTA